MGGLAREQSEWYFLRDYNGRRSRIKVVGPANQEVHFRVKKTTALRKLMGAYCDRQGQDMSALEFLFDGDRIRPEQTPEELEMDDGDSIDAMVKQVGGALACWGSKFTPHLADFGCLLFARCIRS